VKGVVASFRFLLSDVIGADDSAPPELPEHLPSSVVPVAGAAVDRLIDFQGPGYAQLYVDRLRRFTRRRDVGEALLFDVTGLMAQRMCYDDPIGRAQQVIGGTARQSSSGDTAVMTFRLEDVLASMPAQIFQIPIVGINWAEWCHRDKPLRFDPATPSGYARLKMLAGLQRWRPFSQRYAAERAWVERWLHMIDRCLAKQPLAAPVVAQTATMVQGDGDNYRQGAADWRCIIDGLVKPVCDGRLALPDLAEAVQEARAAAAASPRDGAARAVAAIRARVAAAA